MSGSPQAFGPKWLEQRLTGLLPEFPDVSLCVALSGGVDSTVLGLAGLLCSDLESLSFPRSSGSDGCLLLIATATCCFRLGLEKGITTKK